MANPYAPLIPATVAFDASGTPMSPLYGDVYHTDAGALAQAEHVFLHGNRIPDRWRGRDSFTVCETGFGLGHNFLALWQAWRADNARPARLHVVSFEAHPFSRADLERVLLPRLPAALSGLARELIDAWPPLLPGLHRLEFESGRLTLTLAFGTVKRLAKQLSAQVDAYFLDGFAPAKNPEMWTPSLFGQMARMANAGATAASWCCASEVRRALADAGFIVSKAPGFGRKREMTVASLRPTMGRSAVTTTCEPVAVIGGGLAGAGIAHSLALRGHQVTVVDPVFSEGRGASHRGHLAAALTPLISRDDDFRARLTRAGLSRALQRWRDLPAAARPKYCGSIGLALTGQEALDRQSMLQLLAFPTEWVSWLDRDEASRRVGFAVPHGGVFFADGQLVRPEALIEALLDHVNVRCVAGRARQFSATEKGMWVVEDAAGSELAVAPTLVLANAAEAKRLMASTPYFGGLPRLASMRNLAGQVSYFSSAASQCDPRLIVEGDGYWLPAVDGVCVGGSTYTPDIKNNEITAPGHQAIIDKLARLLDVASDRIGRWLDQSGGWAGWRAVATGRLPMIGAIGGAPGLWLACAYGSRGLTWSALAGDIIAARLNHEPLPIERELLRAIAPR